MVRRTPQYLIVLAFCLGAMAAHAQSPRSVTVGAVVVSLAAKHEVTIVLDPSLSAGSLPQGFTPETTVTRSLDLLSARVKEANWQRIQLPKNATRADAERICAEVRAVVGTTARPFAVEDHSRKRTVIVSGLATSDSESKNIYVIFDRTLPADGLTNSDRFAQMQREMMDLMSGLPPEQRSNPMTAWVRVLQSSDKSTIETELRPMSDAGMKMWNQASPGQRQDMMRDGMQVMSRYGSGAPNPSGPSANTKHNYRPQLVDIAGRLSKRFDTQILVEPSLNLGTLRQILGEDENIEAALKALVEPLHGVEWRRVYLTKSVEITRAYVNALAADVRRTTGVRETHLSVSQRDAESSVTIKSVPAMDAPRMSALGLSEKPVYLIYSRFAPMEGDALSQYEHLLASQMRSLMSMNADQLADAMDQAMQSYQNGEAANRLDVMGLPVMAAMMATWMPRAAKEQAGGKP
jgi:hypothetical protein